MMHLKNIENEKFELKEKKLKWEYVIIMFNLIKKK